MAIDYAKYHIPHKQAKKKKRKAKANGSKRQKENRD